MFVVIVSGRVHRTWAALAGAFLTAVIVLRSPVVTFHTVNWETIMFLGGMMVMVAGLGLSGFFRWLCLYVALLARYNTTAIFISFMVLSGFLAMFIDSITVLLFMAAVVIELSYLMGFKPMPFIIALIFAANAGGAATMSGDPPILEKVEVGDSEAKVHYTSPVPPSTSPEESVGVLPFVHHG